MRSTPTSWYPVADTEAALRRALWQGRIQAQEGERERLLALLVPHENGCWVWPGRVRKGFGRVSITVAGRRVEVDVHRAVYVLAVATIPPGYRISQTCRNRRCARPDHYELLSAKQLFDRGVAAGRIRPLRGWLDGHGPARGTSRLARHRRE